MADKNPSSFVIFGTMRSGSNLLERLINQYDGVQCFGELFNKGFVGRVGQQEFMGVSRAARDTDPQQLLDAIQGVSGITPGFRVFAGHDDRVIQQVLADKTCAKIILRRAPVESFVSLKIARKTDQWLIHDEADRKQAKVHFDLSDFRVYAHELDDYYLMIETALAESGQRSFTIGFDDLGKIDVINDLVRFIGIDVAKVYLDQPIKRQNPGTLAEKIINYDEVYAALDLPAPMPGKRAAIPAPVVEDGSILSRVSFSWSQPLAFVPVPSVPEGTVRDWLDSHGGFGKLGHAGELAEWQDKHPEPLAFTVVSHPVTRAYDAFMNKIFSVGGGSYSTIRNALCKQFGMVLPDADTVQKNSRTALDNSGYGIDEHRLAFKQFLTFVRFNMAGETDIRQDGKWAPQTRFVEGYREEFPDLLVFEATDLRFGLAYLENRLALDRHNVAPLDHNSTHLIPLSGIYDSEIETLCVDAYSGDYQRFGFEPLGSL